MSDLISRRAAIDALFELYEYQRDIDPTEAADLVRQGIYLAEKKIERLPSAEKVGKWIYLESDDTFECSVCGGQMVRNVFTYCPWCGARMREDGEEG